MGAFFYMQAQWGAAMATEKLGWLPLLSLVVFFVAFSGGYANVPFILMGELFPVRYRSILGPLSSSFSLMCTFTVVRSFPVMQVTMTPYGAFWFFMCCTVTGVVFVFFVLPETKGKTLEDIEKIFSKKYNADGTLAAAIANATSVPNSQITKIAIPRAQLFPKSVINGYDNIESGNGISTLSLNSQYIAGGTVKKAVDANVSRVYLNQSTGKGRLAKGETIPTVTASIAPPLHRTVDSEDEKEDNGTLVATFL